jgi:hypothetical protein
MAKQGMGKSMGNRECEWIRPRLPLWVDNGDGTGRPAAHGEGGDLSARELRHIERHLASCATCRQYRASMDQALGALATAATELPVVTETRSLWPMLEQRIASRHASAGSLWPKAARGLADRSVRSWGDLDGVRPLRQAWDQDTVREAMTARNGAKTGSSGMSGFILKLGAAAAVLVGLIELSIVRQQRKSAQATIYANSGPLAEQPVTVPTAAVEPLLETSERDHSDIAANQVAELDPPRPAEAPAPRLDAVEAPKSPPNTRFGFDLEHGTPMPPDSREAKPVY